MLNSRIIIKEVSDNEEKLEPPEDKFITFNELEDYKWSIAEIGNVLFIFYYLIINILTI